MTTRRYAEGTEVTPQKSRNEIERVLERYGTDQFVYGHDQERAVIGFTYRDLPVRITLPLPAGRTSGTTNAGPPTG